MKRALDGIKVLDMGGYIAAPYCCMMLADHDADVIRIEPPGGKVDRELGPFAPDGQSMTCGLSYQRNKKNITLNLRTDRGRQILDVLVRKTDILVHNSPKGTEEADVFDYERLSKVNPALIVVAVSGFGQTRTPVFRRHCAGHVGHHELYRVSRRPSPSTGAQFHRLQYGSPRGARRHAGPA